MKPKSAEPKKGEKQIDPGNVTTSYLAVLLGITQPATSKLFQERVIIQNGRRGRYDITDAIPRYIQSIRTSGTAEAGARLKVSQREKLEIENAVRRGELVKIDDAAEVFRQGCISWRSGASAIPRRLATELSNTKSAAACRELLSNEIDDLFAEFEKPLREYFGEAWDVITPTTPRGNGVKTVRKKNTGRMGGRKPNPTARKRGTRKVAK